MAGYAHNRKYRSDDRGISTNWSYVAIFEFWRYKFVVNDGCSWDCV